MRVFLTGGRGMVGRNVREAAAADWTVVAPGRAELDLLDAPAVHAAIAAAAPDLVIHTAGKVGGIAANMADQAGFLLDNARMGFNVVEGALAVPGTRVINLGSSCIYPAGHDTPLSEDMLLTGALEPTNEGYAIAKNAVLRLGQYRNRQLGEARVKTLIPCNLYGRYDMFDPERSHLMPAIVRKIHEATLSGAPTVEIWGDGSARRESLYAGDLARWIVEVAGRFDAAPELMNVGLGDDHSVLDYYRTAAAVIGWRGEFTFDLGRPSGIRRKVMDIARARAFGLSAPRTLEDGLRATFAYYRELSA